MNAKQIAKQLKKSKKIVFFHHVKPDGDSLSSSYALLKAMQNTFKDKEIKWVANKEYIKNRFSYLNIDFKDVISGKEIDKTWTVVIGDNAVLDRIYGSEYYVNGGIKICFDHHRNEINFEHDLYWQQSDLGASAIQAYMIAKKLKLKYNSQLAILALYGILTDTGNFQYSLADPRPLDAASELFKYIQNDDLDKMYQSMKMKTQKDIDIQTYALNNFKIEKGIAYVNWPNTIQKKLKITPDDCARVNLIANIIGVHAWMFFIEYKDEGYIRVEFRSSGLPVNEIAKKFGGGGHIRASGAKLEIDWNLPKKVISEAQKQLKEFLK